MVWQHRQYETLDVHTGWFNDCGSDRNPLITFKHNLKVVAIGKYKNQWLPTWKVFTRSSFIVISWPWESVKIYEIDQWLPTWLMPIYIQNSRSLSNSIQCSIYRTEPGNAFAWITLTTHAVTNFLKIAKLSNQCRLTEFALYSLVCPSFSFPPLTIYFHCMMF